MCGFTDTMWMCCCLFSYSPHQAASSLVSREEIVDYLNPNETDPVRAARRDLFYLAFTKLSTDGKAIPVDGLQSLWSISGIHGEPYVEYDKSAEVGPAERGQWLGYCQHGSVLFPTWHRPYLLLVEKAIQHAAHLVAAELTDPAVQADCHLRADELRLPFWSWAAPGLNDPSNPNYLPLPLRSDTATVRIAFYQPNDALPNPLLAYRFQKNSLNLTWDDGTPRDTTVRLSPDTLQASWPGSRLRERC